MPPASPSPVGSPEAHPPWKRLLLATLLLIMFLFVAAVLGVFFFAPSASVSQISETFQNLPISGATFHSNTTNVQFTIPDGWTLDDVRKPLQLPGNFSRPGIVLRKNGTSCVIVQAKNNDTSVLAGKQMSFADRVYSEHSQFDGSWYVASTSETAHYTFLWEGRQPVPGEFRISGDVCTDPFLLFVTNGTSVPQDCNDDLNALLETVAPYFESVQLTTATKGTLLIERVWDDVTFDAATNKSYEHLRFVDGTSGERREVLRLPKGTNWAGVYSVSGSKIYFPANEYTLTSGSTGKFDTALYELDPFSASVKKIPGTESAGAYISSIYLRDGHIYYLLGDSAFGLCLDGYSNCPADLYSVALSGGAPTKIAHSDIGGMILGYVESEGAFYIRRSWGDAGCSATMFSRIVSGVEEQLGRYSGCYGEGAEQNQAEFEEMRKNVETLNAKAKAGREPANALRVENGSLSPGTFADSPTMYYFD